MIPNRSVLKVGRASVVAGLLLLTTIAGGPPSHASEPMALGGTTVIHGSQPAQLRVSIPVPVTIASIPQSNPDVSIQGQGRFLGVVLTADVADFEGPTIMIGRIPTDAYCDANGCPEQATASMVEPVDPVTPIVFRGLDTSNYDTWPGPVGIPAGTYRLYLMADGGPTTVTLHFHGLAGTVNLAPTTPADVSIIPLTKTVPVAGPAFVAYASHDFGAHVRGMAFSMLWYKAPVDLAGQWHHCIYTADPPANLPPPCVSTALNEHGSDAVPAVEALYGYHVPVDGFFGQEFDSTTAGAIDKLEGVGVWVAFGTVVSPRTSWDAGSAWCFWPPYFKPPFDNGGPQDFLCTLFSTSTTNGSGASTARRMATPRPIKT